MIMMCDNSSCAGSTNNDLLKLQHVASELKTDLKQAEAAFMECSTELKTTKETQGKQLKLRTVAERYILRTANGST